MKKLYFYILMLMPVFALTSCEDAEIASTLEGTWKGNMYISTSYHGHSYDVAYTEITFIGDPYTISSGYGYWVDYYDTGRYRDLSRNYVANEIDWKVDNRVIYIYFREEGTSMRISDYRLNNDRFVGTLNDGGNLVDFELFHTASPNWNRYNYWGYDDWYGDYYYYSRSRGEGAADSTTVEKPVRYVRGK